jgi:hypothetical protein
VKDSSGRSRTPSALSPALSQRLNLYALTASAAGVSLLALAQPSEAEVVYTKTHNVIGTNGIYALDLNHDGTIDFLIQERGFIFSSSGYNGLRAKEAFGNAVEGSNGLAAALSQGARIGSGQQFIGSTSSRGEAMFNVACSVESGCSTAGKWRNVRNRYLGLRFLIDGKTHYGWARLSDEVQGHKITAVLTGYAYETIPGRAIYAGQTHGEASDAVQSEPPSSIAPSSKSPQTMQPTSLGRLALGASGVLLSRRQ